MYANSPERVSQLPAENEIVRLTPEEERIYMECNKEAFFKKGIPYGSVSALTAFAAIKTGLFKSSKNFGYYPIILTAGGIGTFVGLVAHKAACVQKILDMPNSHLKQMIEASKNKLVYPDARKKELVTDRIYTEDQSPLMPTLQVDDHHPLNDFDTFTGVHTDSEQRDDFFTMEPLDKFSGPATTYEELRRKNREEYMRSQLTRPMAGPENPRTSGPQPPPAFPSTYPESSLPFDLDRVPQYQLND
ncbi:OCIA domain-containing protein 1 [Venturia canescens]|uniref:OCIA domain-containing protein 1 n=1 Tax=Venturia canescens TaxID=32260 RepID=UPI001C9CDBD1|nr:OCIA domain-containing protein 1 [Venturia canescens]